MQQSLKKRVLQRLEVLMRKTTEEGIVTRGRTGLGIAPTFH